MKPKVTSLELSKQVKEAGYKQEGGWWWYGKKYGAFLVPESRVHLGIKKEIVAVAPTVGEGLEKLPSKIDYWWTLSIQKIGKLYCVNYLDYNGKIHQQIIGTAHLNCSEAVHLMWLTLKKKGLL